MSALNQSIQDVRRRLAEHAESYPSTSLPEWRQEFDLLRADLDRLKYAQAHRVNTISREPLRV